ncbi:MAG: hypothetical protein JJU06_18770 [Ectothiorhodospiraceae bacterium]|nr:hypothetical protein [Ectothiorhodospiraceae bacterium]MCH8506625.1 hypothetical protein [Ectothiorhodospiraceae bacterium]
MQSIIQTGPVHATPHVPERMLVRDAITRMNQIFATSALVVSIGGRIVGYLDGKHLAFLMLQDSDRLLKTPCGELATELDGALAA